MSLVTQASFMYLAQCFIGLVIGVVLRYFYRIYPRIHLNTWSYSSLLFCIHALTYAWLSSTFEGPFIVRYSASLVSAVCNNLHIALMLIGCYEAIYERRIRKSHYRNALGLAILVGLISTSWYAYDPQKFFNHFLFRIAWLRFVTAVSFVIAGIVLFAARMLKGIGVTIVAFCFVLYGLVHCYHLITIILTYLGTQISAPPIFGLLELVLIAMVGLGLIIWLLEDERAKLEKANRQLDRFIYSTSHDLRAPIASILGLINVARLDVRDAPSLDYFRMIEGRVLKLDQVIRDILSLSRVHKTELRYEMIDFNTLVADSVNDTTFMEQSGTIRLRYQESPENRFVGDYSLTKTVLGNLLSNAVKYHCPQVRDEPYIEVTFRRSAESVSFEVADNGEGIPEEHQRRVFDMFYRASTSNAQGTGLGLYIVKETLARIGGQIEMESKAGHGTRFKVTLAQGNWS